MDYNADLDYLQRFLALCEKVATMGRRKVMNSASYDEELEDDTWCFTDDLNELNKWAREIGVTESLIRDKLVAQDAMTNHGSWYNSSVGC